MNDTEELINMIETRKLLGAAIGKPKGVAYNTVQRYETRGLLKSVTDEITHQRFFVKKDVLKLLEGRKKKIEEVLKNYTNEDETTSEE